MNDSEYQTERRPIASRDKNASKWLARKLADRHVTPNHISLVGMGAGVLAGFAFAATQHTDYWRVAFFGAAVLMQLRLLANMLDGMVAVQTDQASPVGEMYNEIPDRVSDACTMVGAGYALGSGIELGYIASCLALFIAYIRAQGKVAGAPQEFCGPLAKPQRVFLLTVLALLCSFGPASWLAFRTPVAGWGLMAWGLSLLILGECITVIRRLGRIATALKEAS